MGTVRTSSLRGASTGSQAGGRTGADPPFVVYVASRASRVARETQPSYLIAAEPLWKNDTLAGQTGSNGLPDF